MDDKAALMRRLGKKQLTLQLQQALERVPTELSAYDLALSNNGTELTYTYDTQGEHMGISELLKELGTAGIEVKDLSTSQSSLEDIFVDLVGGKQ